MMRDDALISTCLLLASGLALVAVLAGPTTALAMVVLSFIVMGTAFCPMVETQHRLRAFMGVRRHKRPSPNANRSRLRRP